MFFPAVFITASIILIVLIGFPAVSCTILDDYLVRRQDYDSLAEQYEQNLGDLEQQGMALESSLNENEQMKAQAEQKDTVIKQQETQIESQTSQIEALEEKLSEKNIKNLEEQIERLEKDPEKLRKLLYSINDLLKYVYIGSSIEEGHGYTFTAFSIEYKGKYYIVTAGHCVNDNYGKEGLFKFKANFSDAWIYPELIGYNAEFSKLDDYAVFYGEGINGGFKTGKIQTEGNYLAGSIDKGLSIFRDLGDSSRRGESGSPVINEEMEVIGIYVVYGYVYTPIQLVLELIDKSIT
ncbi:MAG: hypothetical protein FJW66_05950 [Actinobacteria bacterium]|nr:hypothetical protein [Actinomycetota bacterium]